MNNIDNLNKTEDVKESEIKLDDNNIKKVDEKPFISFFKNKVNIAFISINSILLLLNIIIFFTNKNGKMTSLTFMILSSLFPIIFYIFILFNELLFKFTNKKINDVSEYISYFTAAILLSFLIFGQFLTVATISGDSMEPTLKNGQKQLISKYNVNVNVNDIVIAKVGPKSSFFKKQSSNNPEFIIKRCVAKKDDLIEFFIGNDDKYYVRFRDKNGKIFINKNLPSQNLDGSFLIDPSNLNLRISKDKQTLSPEQRFAKIINTIKNGLDNKNNYIQYENIDEAFNQSPAKADNVQVINYLEYVKDFTNIKMDKIIIFKIKLNKYFLLGDNYNHSVDSRAYGLIDYNLISGKVLNKHK